MVAPRVCIRICRRGSSLAPDALLGKGSSPRRLARKPSGCTPGLPGSASLRASAQPRPLGRLCVLASDPIGFLQPSLAPTGLPGPGATGAFARAQTQLPFLHPKRQVARGPRPGFRDPHPWALLGLIKSPPRVRPLDHTRTRAPESAHAEGGQIQVLTKPGRCQEQTQDVSPCLGIPLRGTRALQKPDLPQGIWEHQA